MGRERRVFIKLSAVEQIAIGRAIDQYFGAGSISERCPRCGEELTMDEAPNGYELRCTAQSCVRVLNRGI